MKRVDSRQNKAIQNSAASRYQKNRPLPRPSFSENPLYTDQPLSRGKGPVFGLIGDLFYASKIAQLAKHYHLDIHNSDSSESLLNHAAIKLPCIAILDWDHCEAEAFKLLRAFKSDEKLTKVPIVGYLSGARADLKREGENAGCMRIYSKIEFIRVLEDLLVRYGL